MRALILLAALITAAAMPTYAQVRPDLPMAQPPAQAGDSFVFRRAGPAHRGLLQQFMVPGPAGPTGPSGTQGQSGLTGATGAAGSPGVPGLTGASGPAGAIGPTGAAGPAGTPKRVETYSATGNASSIATIVFTPAFAAVPVILVAPSFSGDQMVIGAVTAVSTTGATISVKRTRGTLLLTSGPLEAAPSTSVSIVAIGN